jgi:Tfp pilus assembly protein PilW
MKLSDVCNIRKRRVGLRAFTLAEIQVSMAIIMLVIGGVISSHVFGLKLNEATRAKVSASDAARNAIARLVTEIDPARISYSHLSDNKRQFLYYLLPRFH